MHQPPVIDSKVRYNVGMIREEDEKSENDK